MAAFRFFSQSALSMLVGVVVLHSVVALVPHQHELETVDTSAGLADRWWSLQTTEILPIAEVHAPAQCLACVVPTPAFGGSTGAPTTSIESTDFEEPQLPDRSSSPVRRWRHQLRAPPPHV